MGDFVSECARDHYYFYYFDTFRRVYCPYGRGQISGENGSKSIEVFRSCAERQQKSKF